MFTLTIQTIYLTVLIVAGLITILYLLFSDIADYAVDGVVLFDPAIILPFISITAGAGYLFEKFTSLTSILVFIISIIVSAIITTLFYFFLLSPLRSAEVSLVYSEESLEGQIGRVIVPIPIDGFGEVVIESINGILTKRAASYKNVQIPYDAKVLIIESKEGTIYVVEYEN